MRSTDTEKSVLFIGGTGTISSAAVRLATERGLQVTVLNRGINRRERSLPEGVRHIKADVLDHAALAASLGDLRFSAVVNFLCYDAEGARRDVELFSGRTDQYILISSASIYRKPILALPLRESTPRANPFVKYSRDKIAAEDVVMSALESAGFPVTVVRPSHTYDEASPPLPGGWTAIERMLRGDPVVVHGDGTSLWTLTHATDFAHGLVGLIGHPRAVGEVFHITSDEVYTWDAIYRILADAWKVDAELVHVPSEAFTLAAPEWGWSELILGDLSHSAVFDNSKIRQFVPDFTTRIPFHQSASAMVRWRADHPGSAVADTAAEAVFTRIVDGYRRSRAIFAELGATS